MYLANSIFPGSAYDKSPTYLPTGRQLIEVIGVAKLTDTLQTAIPLQILSTKPKTLENDFPSLPMTLPIGAQIERVDFRLPKPPAQGDSPIFGVDLPKGCTIIGTTGEKLKITPVSLPFTPTLPAITSVSSTYAVGATAVLSRAAGVADSALPNLLGTLAAPLTFQLTCTNSADSAAGTGVRLSVTSATAYVYSRIIYTIPGDAVPTWAVDLPAS